jgi:AraC-like DNA-binding protein
MHNGDAPQPTLTLFLPPYDRFTNIVENGGYEQRGMAVVWRILDAKAQEPERDWLSVRPARISLIIVLPPAAVIRNALTLVRDANALRPRGVLPNSGANSPEPLRLLLGSAPRDLAALSIGHLSDRRLLRNHRIRGLVKRIFDMASTVPSISTLSRKLYTSRRTLGRAFEGEGLPVPSHWLQLARLLHTASLIQERPNMPIARAAMQVGYPDGFTMSNQMKRLIGCRPSEVRERLGLTWLLEDWIYQERICGRLLCDDYHPGYRNVDEWFRNYPSKLST